MDTFRMAATNGGYALVSESDISALRARLRGPLVQAGESGYEEACTLFNAMIDRRPALVARCQGAADVMAAVNFVRDHDVLVFGERGWAWHRWKGCLRRRTTDRHVSDEKHSR